MPSLFKPAASTDPLWLLAWAAVKVVLPRAASVPLLFSVPAVFRRVSACAYTLPLLTTPAWVSVWILPLALMWPAFSRRPSAVTMTSPALAPIVPRLRTPTPASVPTSVILPAYMPPSAAVSMPYTGALPLAEVVVTVD
ncbi:hypothetical protein WG78_15680 [Amantichitinum ursilacus]|uniref:Uncharacterized protein n=1 Tax=Amantichitinum ursilacus TaxID=857265 RepID=A0A0N0XIT6_9NEIS|nr:hypothetical protein WG78_15680 [Amantichitinum ursilacus]